jgi:hypothetical protein
MPDRDSRGRTPIRVGLATAVVVVISLTVPVSASLAVPDAAAPDQPAQAKQEVPATDAAPPTGPAGVPAHPEAESSGPSGVTTESSEPVVGPPAAEKPGSQSGGAEAAGSPKPPDGTARPAHDPAEPPRTAVPGSPTGAPEAKPIPAGRSDTVDSPGETAAAAWVDADANATIVATRDDAEAAPVERSPAETASPSRAGDTNAGSPREVDPRRAVSDALQPDPVEVRTRPSRPSARPRGEKANRRADGTRRNMPVRTPRAPDSAVCSASSACAASPLGMMPVLAALGCLCALIFERLLHVAGRWRPHRFVSLRERPG